MNTQQMIKELEAAAEKLGLQVRLERGSFRGGRCRVSGQDLIVLNKHQPPEMHLAVLAESLRDLPVDTVFLRPAVRNALEAAWQRQPSPGEAEAPDVEP